MYCVVVGSFIIVTLGGSRSLDGIQSTVILVSAVVGILFIEDIDAVVVDIFNGDLVLFVWYIEGTVTVLTANGKTTQPFTKHVEIITIRKKSCTFIFIS